MDRAGSAVIGAIDADQVIFDEVTKGLVALRMVNVYGLPIENTRRRTSAALASRTLARYGVHKRPEDLEEPEKTVRVAREFYGCYCIKGTKAIIVTHIGRIWLGDAACIKPDTPETYDLEEAEIPLFEEGEDVNGMHFRARLLNPNQTFGGLFPPAPSLDPAVSILDED